MGFPHAVQCDKCNCVLLDEFDDPVVGLSTDDLSQAAEDLDWLVDETLRVLCPDCKLEVEDA